MWLGVFTHDTVPVQYCNYSAGNRWGGIITLLAIDGEESLYSYMCSPVHQRTKAE